MAIADLTPDYLRELFSYDPHEGLLRWKIRKAHRITVGSVAGSINGKGYLVVSIDGKSCQAHRVIWTMMTGAWPKDQIDHINGIRSDNRLVNLREATNELNCQNRYRPHKDGTNRFLGVTKNAWSFIAHITVHGKNFYLGSFKTAELAHAAYIDAKRKLHPSNML